jgi:hypothetical protein
MKSGSLLIFEVYIYQAESEIWSIINMNLMIQNIKRKYTEMSSSSLNQSFALT